MASFSQTTTTETVEINILAQEADQNSFSGGDAALLMAGALAGATMAKATKRQYRQLSRKMAWQAMGYKLKGLFNKKYRGGGDMPEVAGLNFWVFLAIVVGAAALGTWLFGFVGFLILLGIGIIIYLLLQDK
jgi:hypothetical protein